MITCIIKTQHVVRLQGGSGEYKRTCIVEICHRNWSQRSQLLDLNNTYIVSLYSSISWYRYVNLLYTELIIREEYNSLFAIH